ncbi:MAG: class I SAM-dependent methyltransferase [Myxococcota bacterium]
MSTLNIRDMHEANRLGWNEGAAAYVREVQQDIEFLRAGGKNLCPPEFRYLRDLTQWCRRAIHLQCAGGKDTLSLWNHGAHEVVGVDISEVMLSCAQQKSDALGAPAQWIRSDVLAVPHTLDGTADLVYTGRGALGWLHDLNGWAQVIFRLLVPGGRLYIFEGHPLTCLFDMDTPELRLVQTTPDDPEWGACYSYFGHKVGMSQGWPETYIGNAVPKAQQAMKYERLWTLGEVLNALVDAGLRLERLEEHPDRYWKEFPHMPEEMQDRFPHTFSLLMRKP